MSEKNEPAQGLDPKTVKGSCFARPLPEKLPCECKTEDVTAVGEGFQCECGRRWKVAIIEDVPKDPVPKFKAMDSVRIRKTSPLHPGKIGAVLESWLQTSKVWRYGLNLCEVSHDAPLWFDESELEAVS